MLRNVRAHPLEQILTTSSRLELQRNRRDGLGGIRRRGVAELRPPRLTAWRESAPQAGSCAEPPYCDG
jgi:hypothetical protein